MSRLERFFLTLQRQQRPRRMFLILVSMGFYLPGQYCVDGELDNEEYLYQYEGEGDEGRGLYEKVVVCEEKGDIVRSCKVEDPNC